MGRWICTAYEYYKAMYERGEEPEDVPFFIDGDHIACSECGHRFLHMQIEGIEDWEYCPICGSKNEDSPFRGNSE